MGHPKTPIFTTFHQS